MKPRILISYVEDCYGCDKSAQGKCIITQQNIFTCGDKDKSCLLPIWTLRSPLYNAIKVWRWFIRAKKEFGI